MAIPPTRTGTPYRSCWPYKWRRSPGSSPPRRGGSGPRPGSRRAQGRPRWPRRRRAFSLSPVRAIAGWTRQVRLQRRCAARPTSPLRLDLRCLRRNPGQSIAPELRRLGARYAVFLGDDKEGHALNAEAIALLLQLDDGLEAVRIAERAFDGLGLEIGLDGQLLQQLGVADVARLLEVGMKQTLDQGFLPPLTARLPDQPVGKPRVGRALHALEGKGDPELLAGCHHVAVEFGAAGRSELAVAVGLPLDPLHGHVGVEFEGSPGQARRRGHVRAIERGLEPPLADVTPGTDHVRIDDDREGIGHRGHGRNFPC